MSRLREAGIPVVLVLVLASAGCLGFVTGDRPLEFAADPAAVDDATLGETAYRLSDVGSPNRTLNVSAAGQTRQVTVSNERRAYNRTVTVVPGVEGDFARFAVYTTPAVSVAGQSINPVGDWSNGRLVRQLVESTSGLSAIDFASNRSVEFLGAERTVSTFTATQSVGGMETNVTIHLTSAEHEGDYVIATAVHPERVDEQSRVDALLRGLEHPAA